MKARVIVTALTASFVFVAGAAFERATRDVATPAPVMTTAAAPKVAPQRLTNLVTLPEVTVRPSAEDIALAMAQPLADTESDAATVPDSPVYRRAASGRGGFDMPYYSFGKVLPQVSQD